MNRACLGTWTESVEIQNEPCVSSNGSAVAKSCVCDARTGRPDLRTDLKSMYQVMLDDFFMRRDVL